MFVTAHAGERMWQRFGVNPNKIPALVTNATHSFWIIDRKLSYDKTVELGRRRIVQSRNPNAWFVLDTQNHVVTVLTEDQAMNNFKNGKWSRL